MTSVQVKGWAPFWGGKAIGISQLLWNSLWEAGNTSMTGTHSSRLAVLVCRGSWGWWLNPIKKKRTAYPFFNPVGNMSLKTNKGQIEATIKQNQIIAASEWRDLKHFLIWPSSQEETVPSLSPRLWCWSSSCRGGQSTSL